MKFMWKMGVLTLLTAFGWTVSGADVSATPPMVLIPAGSFEMGDHHGFVDPKHGSDEVPIHTVRLDAFQISTYDITTQEYCAFLNAALAQGQVEVRPDGGVYWVAGKDLLCDTRLLSPYSRIGWDGNTFKVLDGKERHPMVCVRWPGAVVYCNWLSARQKLPQCYNTRTWECGFNTSGFRLPTEAEWEYAARGGQFKPYFNYPWGDDADPAKANVPESDNPFRSGPQPWTTPVGFFNGKLQRKADFGWPGQPETYQTQNGANGFGLYDTAGNVWQWCTEWYERNYYAYSPSENPPGPESGGPMPDGKPYRCIRGGSWSNGEFGHSRVSNRDPSYFRGPDPLTRLSDPNGPWFHIGFRVVCPVKAENRPALKPTPVQHVAVRQQGGGDREGNAGGGDRRGGNRGGGNGGEERVAANGGARDRENGVASAEVRKPSSTFVLHSSDVKDGGALPVEYTGDGVAATLPLDWSGAPAETKSYALIMHHIPGPGTVKWYWILYNIPADVQSLPTNVKGIGTLGTNSVNDRTEYAPPRSKGPGPKKYIYTLYALSAPPQITVQPAQVNREVLLAAMKDRILSSTELQVTYTRQGLEGGQGPRPDGQNREGPTQDAAVNAPRGRGDAETRGIGAAQRGEGGGREVMPENKTPVSPNSGQTVGLFLNTPKSFKGYTLFAPKHNTVIYLMDNEGRAVHQWKSTFEPGQTVYLKPNGNLLHCCFTKNRGFTSGGEGGRVEEFDWNGNLVWEFEYSTDQHLSHHDIAPLPNGNILLLAVEKKSLEECLAVGFNPEMLRDRQLFPDSVIEVQPTLPKGGKVVWEWRVWDHLIQDFDKTKANYGDVAAHPELIDVHCNGRAVPAFWNHMNSINYNAKLDQIVVSARGCNEIWFLDHSTSTQEAAGHSGGKHGKGGDLIYRWGNPAAYRRGTIKDKQLIQQHDAQWIPDDCPGAGHLTIFNNGYDRGWSSIEEIVPPVDAQGRYVLEAGKAYGPAKPVWHYDAQTAKDFFSSEISGAHRLPNGNTLVCAGVIGNLFEITAAGETVWQYVNPMVRGGILAQGELPGKDMRGHLWNAVFKVHRYAPNYPGLAGRDLTPKGVIELPASEKGKTGLDQVSEQPRDNRDRPGGGGGGGGSRGDRQNRGDRPPRRDNQGGGDLPPPPPRDDQGGDNRPPRPREQ